MRTTYEKTTNVITVELSQEEVEQYCSQELSSKDQNLRKVEDRYQLTVPCGSTFYRMTQRQKGGVQPWGPQELRQAIRAAVANRLVPWEPDFIAPEAFYRYKTAWNSVFQGLLRNVRLKFPNRDHPRKHLSRAEFQYRKKWRAQHVRR
tara:strand:- start:1408 stop:1851 length:444 start_codon:yes stop_codon:yes gene_type:complete